MRGLLLFFGKTSAEFRIRRKAAEVRNRRAGTNSISSGGCAHSVSIRAQVPVGLDRRPPVLVCAARHVAQH
jgi:hypothetical protein